MGTRTFDGYGRVSRRQGRHGAAYISPSVQREGVQRWADYHQVTLDRWHFDEDRTGRNQNRPGMREAIRRVEAGEVNGIVCLRLNRFARNVVGALEDFRRIQAAGGEIVFVEEQIDTSGPVGRLMLTVLLAMAEWEHENLSASFEVAKRRAVARGAYVSRTPWGYQRNPDGTLTPHPQRAPIVAEAFRLAAGDSLQRAAQYLREVAPEREWSATKTRRLLSQRSYLGETRNGDLLQEGTHEPVVSRAIWEAAQTTPIRRGPREKFVLVGITRCAACGSIMYGSRGGAGQRVYRCSALHRGSAVITATLLEDHVRKVAADILGGLSWSVGEPEADKLTVLERTVAEAEGELDAFAADMTLRRALGERYHQHLQSRLDAVEAARAAYRQHSRRVQESLRLDAPDVLEDPQLLPLVLGSMFAAILVSPGRQSVGERVRFVGVDDDGTAGVANP